MVETLVGDFGGRRDDIATVLAAIPEVFAHNIEVVARLTPQVRDRRCSYARSLEVLAEAKRQGVSRYVKSSVMVGLGETDAEILETLIDLRRAGVDIVTIGQYLRPSAKHAAVQSYRAPEEFVRWQRQGQELGFAFVASGPLVRSSYQAAEVFVAAGVDPEAVAHSTGPMAAPRPTGGGEGAAQKAGGVMEDTGIVPISRLTGPR
jgi:lipoic acid synthetase